MKLHPAILVVLLLPVGVFAQGPDPIAGAWEGVSGKNVTTGAALPDLTPPLHVIYAGGHYVQFTAAANRAKVATPVAEMTKEQLLDRYRMQGQYGTYRVQGNKVIRKIVAAANPNNEGNETTSDFRIAGDTLIITSTNPQKQTIETRFRRLRPTS